MRTRRPPPIGVLWQALAWLVRSLVGRLLDVLSPPSCSGCDARLARPAIFCPCCATSVEAWPGGRRTTGSADWAASGAVPTVACGLHGGALAQAIYRLKYRNRPDLARPLGELLRAAAQQLAGPVDVVVPVPLHGSKLAARGYNQSALLARRVARQLGARFAPRALARLRPSSPQVSLRRDERRRAVSGAFAARQPGALRGRSVLLVDDVTTTGATLEQCARAALAAGACRVAALVLSCAEQQAWARETASRGPPGDGCCLP